MFMFVGTVWAGLILATGAAGSEGIDAQDMGAAAAAFSGLAVTGYAIFQAEIAHEARDAARQQADAAASQLAVMQEQIELQRAEISEAQHEGQWARGEAEANRADAARTLRATIKQRLDARAPQVLAHTEQAGNGDPVFQWQILDPSKGPIPTDSGWNGQTPSAETHNLNVSNAPVIRAKLTIGIRFYLINDQPARIDCDCIEKFDLKGAAWPIILTPISPEARLTYTKVISGNEVFINASNKGLNQDPVVWRPRFLVRDLGMNVGDEIGFSANLSPFKRDGDYLTITPESVNFGENYAGQSRRHYEYFESSEGQTELGVTQSGY